MQFLAILASMASLVSLTTAAITGFSAPSTIVPGSKISLRLQENSNKTSPLNVAVAFGVDSAGDHVYGSLGTFMGQQSLGLETSGGMGNITVNVTVPTDRPRGHAKIMAALFSLEQPYLKGNVSYYAADVAIGNETSTEYEMSYPDVLPHGNRWAA